MAEYIGCDRVPFRQPIAERHYEVLRKDGRGQRTKPASRYATKVTAIQNAPRNGTLRR
ncbi:hypothetical protein QFZ91_002441 [Paraburkholderia sp. JPY419]